MAKPMGTYREVQMEREFWYKFLNEKQWDGQIDSNGIIIGNVGN